MCTLGEPPPPHSTIIRSESARATMGSQWRAVSDSVAECAASGRASPPSSYPPPRAAGGVGLSVKSLSSAARDQGALSHRSIAASPIRCSARARPPAWAGGVGLCTEPLPSGSVKSLSYVAGVRGRDALAGLSCSRVCPLCEWSAARACSHDRRDGRGALLRANLGEEPGVDGACHALPERVGQRVHHGPALAGVRAGGQCGGGRIASPDSDRAACLCCARTDNVQVEPVTVLEALQLSTVTVNM